MLQHVSACKIPTTVCTMYKPNFDTPEQRKMSETGLAVLNDVIITEAIKVRTDLYDWTSDFFSSFSLVFLLLILKQSLMIQKITPMPLNLMFKVDRKLSKIFFTSSIIIDFRIMFALFMRKKINKYAYDQCI